MQNSDMLYYRHKENNRPQGVGLMIAVELPPKSLGQSSEGGFSMPYNISDKSYIRMSATLK